MESRDHLVHSQPATRLASLMRKLTPPVTRNTARGHQGHHSTRISFSLAEPVVFHWIFTKKWLECQKKPFPRPLGTKEKKSTEYLFEKPRGCHKKTNQAKVERRIKPVQRDLNPGIKYPKRKIQSGFQNFPLR